jgi:molybdopterin converting factor small subunit
VAVTIRIPARYRHLADGASEVTVGEGTVLSALTALIETYPRLEDRILIRGQLRHGLDIDINGEDIGRLNGLATKVWNGDVLRLVADVDNLGHIRTGG